MVLDDPYAFFHYLQTQKQGIGIQLLSEIKIQKGDYIKSSEYYDMITFKTFICEIIFNAINLFPDIHEYTIKFKSKQCENYFRLGFFEELADDAHPCMGKILIDNTEHLLTIRDIKNLYTNNRYRDIDNEVLNAFVTLMYRPGISITTSFKNKSANKIKF